MKSYRILIVDDLQENCDILEAMLGKNPEYRTLSVNDGMSTMLVIKDFKPDLILLDIMMPGMSGFQLIDILKKEKSLRDIPVIFISAIQDVEKKVEAFDHGVVDYITKPFFMNELLGRVKTHLSLKTLRDDLKSQNLLLEDREALLQKIIIEKTEQLENMTLSIVSALEGANFYNDNDTGTHIRRVSDYSTLLAEKMGFEKSLVKKIGIYASLHDVGKVGISDSLLKKKGIYSPEERQEMQEHVRIGYKILNSSGIEDMARNIAYYHHEHWDGKGYVNGLKGEEIPLEARIVSIADVYDALLSKRSYKEAYDDKKAIEIITNGAGSQFDPDLVDIFLVHHKELYDIYKGYQ
ncbi:MAG: response regulator [Leptospiraceae bacterium]|nr:response regulator [Leptospiraceae bacterium]